MNGCRFVRAPCCLMQQFTILGNARYYPVFWVGAICQHGNIQHVQRMLHTYCQQSDNRTGKAASFVLRCILLQQIVYLFDRGTFHSVRRHDMEQHCSCQTLTLQERPSDSLATHDSSTGNLGRQARPKMLCMSQVNRATNDADATYDRITPSYTSRCNAFITLSVPYRNKFTLCSTFYLLWTIRERLDSTVAARVTQTFN